MKRFQQVTALAAPVDLSGRTALVIGATAGIGAAVARQLAEAGAIVILTGRDATKLDRMRSALEAIAPNRIRTVLADLADLASIRSATSKLCADHARLDIVIANASVMFSGGKRHFTTDGYEMTFGVNHIGNAAFLLGLEAPIRSARGRVVIVASESHRRAAGLPLDDLMGERGYSGLRAYARSKLANIIFARQLAAHWPEVTVHAAHPGGVMTDMMRGAARNNWLFGMIIRLLRNQLLTPQEAAKGIVRVALEPTLTVPNGGYFELGRPDRPSQTAQDARLGEALYAWTVDALRSRGFETLGLNRQARVPR